MAEDERQYQTQKRGGTHKENFLKLQSEFHKILKDGSISVRGLHQMMSQLLKSFENQRLQSEKQIRKLRDELSFNEGTANACAMFSNLLVSLIEGYNSSGMLGGISSEELKKEEKTEKEEPAPEVDSGPTAEDILKTVCANCACQDEGDMASCDCNCHNGKHCGNKECVICDDLSNYKFLRKKKRGRPKKK